MASSVIAMDAMTRSMSPTGLPAACRRGEVVVREVARWPLVPLADHPPTCFHDQPIPADLSLPGDTVELLGEGLGEVNAGAGHICLQPNIFYHNRTMGTTDGRSGAVEAHAGARTSTRRRSS